MEFLFPVSLSLLRINWLTIRSPKKEMKIIIWITSMLVYQKNKYEQVYVTRAFWIGRNSSYLGIFKESRWKMFLSEASKSMLRMANPGRLLEAKKNKCNQNTIYLYSWLVKITKCLNKATKTGTLPVYFQVYATYSSWTGNLWWTRWKRTFFVRGQQALWTNGWSMADPDGCWKLKRTNGILKILSEKAFL